MSAGDATTPLSVVAAALSALVFVASIDKPIKLWYISTERSFSFFLSASLRGGRARTRKASFVYL